MGNIRRSRHDAPEITRYVKPTAKDIEWFSFIHRHGGVLPTTFIHDYTSFHLTSKKSTQNRLTILFGSKYLTRPQSQKRFINPLYCDMCHKLTDESLAVLRHQSKYSQYTPHRNPPFEHQVMLSSISASIELNAKANDIGYTPQHEILERVGHPSTFTVGNKEITPDGICMLKINGKDALIILEVDRATEATHSIYESRRSWNKTIGYYKEYLTQNLYKEHYGVDCPVFVMIITTEQAKREGIVKVIEEAYPNGCKNILVSHIPEYGVIYSPPQRLDILGRNWSRAKYGEFNFCPQPTPSQIPQ